jgi:hypothetical protein
VSTQLQLKIHNNNNNNNNNNNMGSINSTEIATTFYSLGTWFVSGIYVQILRIKEIVTIIIIILLIL